MSAKILRKIGDEGKVTKHRLRKCSFCKIYTLRDECTNCRNPTLDPHPPKFSLEDKYIRYRIESKYLNK